MLEPLSLFFCVCVCVCVCFLKKKKKKKKIIINSITYDFDLILILVCYIFLRQLFFVLEIRDKKFEFFEVIFFSFLNLNNVFASFGVLKVLVSFFFNFFFNLLLKNKVG